MLRRQSSVSLVLLSLVPLITVVGTATAKPLAERQTAAVDQAVEAELKQQGIVGAAVAIVQGGEIVYAKGYGLADRDKRTPVTPQTVFNWASNSKPLAAVAAMQLVERGLLDLDADVRTYVPEFPDKGAVITTRQLLCHQSGIPHYANGQVVPTKQAYDTPRPFIDPVVALDKFNQSPLLFTPGERDSYSSYAYILLSAVIQRAGKEPFQTQIEKRIAKPLGMRSLQLDVEFDKQKNWATGYVKKGGQVVRATEQAHYWKHGAGGFKSDVVDFARFAQALVNHRLMSAESEKKAWTAQTMSDGKRTNRGLGFLIDDQGGLKISHNGEQDEVKTRLVIYPEKKRGVVVMCNCEFADPGDISTAVFKALGR